eukprot:scaffold105006_cov69-Phaeocystis_antarctica.AAC.1
MVNHMISRCDERRRLFCGLHPSERLGHACMNNSPHPRRMLGARVEAASKRPQAAAEHVRMMRTRPPKFSPRCAGGRKDSIRWRHLLRYLISRVCVKTPGCKHIKGGPRCSLLYPLRPKRLTMLALRVAGRRLVCAPLRTGGLVRRQKHTIAEIVAERYSADPKFYQFTAGVISLVVLQRMYDSLTSGDSHSHDHHAHKEEHTTHEAPAAAAPQEEPEKEAPSAKEAPPAVVEI